MPHDPRHTPPAPPDPAGRLVRLDAHAAADAAGRRHSPASLLLLATPDPSPPPSDLTIPGLGVCRDLRTLAVGTPWVVDAWLADHHASLPPDEVIALPASILIPPLVNPHVHLDLSRVGPRPFDVDAGFPAWAGMVREARPTTPDAIADATALGVRLSLAGGVAAVGDIGGAPRGVPSLVPLETLAASPLAGVGFVEFFGIGRSAPDAGERLRAAIGPAVERFAHAAVRLGVQPHAPTTVDLEVYLDVARWAAGLGLPLSTHLAETIEERAFIADGAGPHADFLRALGLWTDDAARHLGRGRHPVAHLAGVLRLAPWLVAHVNDATDEAIALLGEARASVAYCPRAAAYFRAETRFGPHRFRDMLRAGVNVCLGTDSVINAEPRHVSPDHAGSLARLSPLDDARLLHRRALRTGSDPDATLPDRLLEMLTVRGAAALGLPRDAFTFLPDAPLAGVVALPRDPGAADGDPWAEVLASDTCPELLLVCKNSCQTGA